MSNRFYVKQPDYIQQLNLLDDQVQAGATGSVSAGCTSFNGRTGPITLVSGDVTGALGYTPYNGTTNPNGYVTSGAIGSYAPLESPAFTGTPTAPTVTYGGWNTQVMNAASVKEAIVKGAGVSTVAFSATPNFAAASDHAFFMTLTGNVTGATLATGTNGQTLRLFLQQDATGNRTFSFAANQVLIGTAGPSLSLVGTANSITIVGLIYLTAVSRWLVVSVSGGF
jgi:hypothetical protein